MKKIKFGILFFFLALMALVVYVSVAQASDKPDRNQHRDDHRNGSNYNPDKQLSKSVCGSKLGNPVVDVTEKVRNDVDSGFAGNWAFDYYDRSIKVWSTGESTYCALVTYDGNFYAVPGQSGPGDPDTTGPKIDSPVVGDMSGGYTAIITGSLLSSPTWSTHGSVGTVNYKCNLSGTACSYLSWTDQYFTSGYLFNYNWWGWQYKGGNHGTWTNAVDILQPVSGNIL